MTEASHTPGPWRVDISPRRGVLCVVSDDTWICGELECNNHTKIGKAETEANARVISAAPDMLAVLKAILTDKHPDVRLRPDDIYAAKLAVAKATGEAA